MINKPTYLGFGVLEMSKMLMYETYYDTLHHYFRQENFQLHYMDCDSFVLSNKTKIFLMTWKISKIYSISVIWMRIINYSAMKKKKKVGFLKLKHQNIYGLMSLYLLEAKHIRSVDNNKLEMEMII